jgi:hypothetical protein
MARKLTGMTIAQLRERLADFDDDDVVVLAHRYGDRWNTLVGVTVSDADEGRVEWSDYHRMWQVEDTYEGDPLEGDAVHSVVVLS